jgi:AcrR family transcriptional regulator
VNVVQYVVDVATGQAALGTQRRREILESAASLLAERSWDGFTMRDVAARAGLSAGAVYQYFEGKGEIFAALYRDRLQLELDTIQALGDADLRTLARRVVGDFAEIYLRVGRHQLAWSAEGIKRTEAVTQLGSTFTALAAALETALENAARREGRELVPGPGRMPFLWSLVNGVGDQLIDERHRLHDCNRDDFLDYAADALVAGFTRPVA